MFSSEPSRPLAGATYAGEVFQEGLIESMRGNVTLAGRSIRQSGAVTSSTSVSYNGRIDIQASYGSITETPLYNATNLSSGRPIPPTANRCR